MSAPTPLKGVLFDLSYTLLSNGRTESFVAGAAAAGVTVANGTMHTCLAAADRGFQRAHPDRLGQPVYHWIDDYIPFVANALENALAGAHQTAGPDRRATVSKQAATSDRLLEGLRSAGRRWAKGGFRWRAYDDVRPTLQRLRDGGIKLAVVSNWDSGGRVVLQEAGFADQLDAVALSGEVGVAKPAPLIFQTALTALSLEPREVVMVGDVYGSDVVGAANAGIRAVLLDRYYVPGPRLLPCTVARSLSSVVEVAAHPERCLPPPVPPANRSRPATPLPSASFVLLRDGAQGPEVLMGMRAQHVYMPGVAVFPGGAVHAMDEPASEAVNASPGRDAGHLPHWTLPSDHPSEHAFRRAGIRETFEETGIWLGGSPGPGDDARSRLLLDDDPSLLPTIAPEALGAPVALGWLEAPPHLAKRFHTRFYAVRCPADAQPTPHAAELSSLNWWRPEDALAAPDLPLMPPTRAVLRAISGHATAAGLLAAARSSREPWLTPGMSLPLLP